MCFVWFSELNRLFLCTVLTTRHYSGDKIEKNVMGGACMRDRRGAYRVLVGKSEEKRPLGRPNRRWEKFIKMDLQEVGMVDGMD
jgi:hypothetical protein